jgi:glycopeptide antibiotics resistance protein
MIKFYIHCMVNDKNMSYIVYTVVIVYFKLMYLNQLAKKSTAQLRKSGTLKMNQTCGVHTYM